MINATATATATAALPTLRFLLPTLRFLLPGQWASIPLHDTEVARSAIRQLVDVQIGKADQLAGLRRDIRSRLLDSLETSIAGAGQSMQVALEMVPGVPISANFTVYLPDVSLAPAIGTSGAAVLEVLRRGLTDVMDLSSEHRFAAGDSEVLRLQRVVTREAEGQLAAITSLIVDYWVTVPGAKRVVLVSFSTLFSDLSDVMVNFFDSIVRASYWQQPTS